MEPRVVLARIQKIAIKHRNVRTNGLKSLADFTEEERKNASVERRKK